MRIIYAWHLSVVAHLIKKKIIHAIKLMNVESKDDLMNHFREEQQFTQLSSGLSESFHTRECDKDKIIQFLEVIGV